MKRMAWLLPLSLFVFSCSDSNSPGAFCPTIGDQGPALGMSGDYLLVAYVAYLGALYLTV